MTDPQITDNSFIQTKKAKDNSSVPTIAVIDDFSNKSIFIDYDDKPDISHGRAVKQFIEDELPQAKIITFDTKVGNGFTLTHNINVQLEKILNELEKNNKKYNSINLSQEASMSFETISKVTNKNINNENISQNKDYIKNLIYSIKTDGNSDSSKYIKDVQEILHKLDKITSMGVKVYISAGNEGKDEFNIFSLSKNVNTVGALSKYGTKAVYTADNSLINYWTCGDFDIKKVTDSKGVKGFDFTNDGVIDVYDNETTSKDKVAHPFGVVGTSFSTPRALAFDLTKRN